VLAQDDEGGSASGCCSSPSQPTQIVVQSALQSQQGINRRAMLGTGQGVQLLSQQVYLRCPFWVRASALMQLVSTHRWNTLSSCVCTQKPQISPCVTLLCCAPPFSSPQALRPSVKSAIAVASSAAADVQLAPGDTLVVGSLQLLCLATPGHTNGCMCFYLPGNGSRTGMVFTGALRKNGGRGRPGRGRWVRCKGVGV
jgi:hypothetical protein